MSGEKCVHGTYRDYCQLCQQADDYEQELTTLRAENARLTKTIEYKDAGLHEMVVQKSADSAHIARLTAECEALRADVVWLLAHKMIGYGDRISYAKEPRSWSLRKELDHDGTPDGILRAVREARER